MWRLLAALAAVLAFVPAAQAMHYFSPEDRVPVTHPAPPPPPPPPPAPPPPPPHVVRSLEKGAFFECNHVDAATRNAVFQLLQSAGTTWVRTYVHWHQAQPLRDGPLDGPEIANLRACAQDAPRYGLRLLVYVLDAPLWAVPAGTTLSPWACNCPTPYTAAFYGKLAAMFRGQVAAWEIWNEPNLDLFWHGTAADYARLLIDASQAVKTADPGALVVAGGLSLSDMKFLQAEYDAGAGTAVYDVQSVHPYPHEADPPEAGVEQWGLSGVGRFREIMLRNDDRRPVWITEYGWSTVHVDEQTQARYLSESLTYIRDRLPFVPVAAWFQAYDLCCTPWERGLALIRADLTPRPAYAAFAHG